MRLLGGGVQACVAITHVDGLVLARSAFNHSMNYRSAVIYGQFEAVPDEADKLDAVNAFMARLAPGREHEARPGNRKELGATIVLKISLAEAAAKVRVGPPQDDEEDMHVPAWAGVLPLHSVHGEPVPDAHNTQDAPAYVRDWVDS
jgi:nitroimidazol reductase NimA-like FMN-containing flavoprotein (pyridoxamine 5'-phosphate oxidase superfamily)